MLRPLESSDKTWLGSYANDFHSRFLSLLSYRFRAFDSVTALSINESAVAGARLDPSYSPAPFTKESLDQVLTPFDLKRLAGYANNVLDYHVICEYNQACSFFGLFKHPGVYFNPILLMTFLSLNLPLCLRDNLLTLLEWI